MKVFLQCEVYNKKECFQLCTKDDKYIFILSINHCQSFVCECFCVVCFLKILYFDPGVKGISCSLAICVYLDCTHSICFLHRSVYQRNWYPGSKCCHQFWLPQTCWDLSPQNWTIRQIWTLGCGNQSHYLWRQVCFYISIILKHQCCSLHLYL